jgi:hypothetical protein
MRQLIEHDTTGLGRTSEHPITTFFDFVIWSLLD